MSPSKPFHIHLSSGTDTANPHEAALPAILPQPELQPAETLAYTQPKKGL